MTWSIFPACQAPQTRCWWAHSESVGDHNSCKNIASVKCEGMRRVNSRPQSWRTKAWMSWSQLCLREKLWLGHSGGLRCTTCVQVLGSNFVRGNLPVNSIILLTRKEAFSGGKKWLYAIISKWGTSDFSQPGLLRSGAMPAPGSGTTHVREKKKGQGKGLINRCCISGLLLCHLKADHNPPELVLLAPTLH